MTLYKWSQTAETNGTADSTCPFPEGMAPSALNDSGRGAMAAVAKYRDDIGGRILTAGTSSAYTISTSQEFDSLTPSLNGAQIGFTPHITNSAPVTLNVDSLGAKPLRSAPSVELLPGMLVAGTLYAATYVHTDGAFYLHGFFGNPYNIPLGCGIEYWGDSVPNSQFAFPVGQAVSRTGVYAPLFSIFGTKYGAGDGSTTFNLPSKAGRLSVMKEASASLLPAPYFAGDSRVLGAVGGQAASLVNQDNLSPMTFPFSASVTVNSTLSNFLNGSSGGNQSFGGSGVGPFLMLSTSSSFNTVQSTGTVSGSASSNGSGHGVSVVQPTIVCNYIIRVI